MRRERTWLALILALVAFTSWFARELQHRRVELVGRPGWVTTDPDSQYHMRRLERALDEGLPPAEFDERMNAPDGAPIPWPPYYTAVLWTVLAPFAPDEARSAWVERRVASAACVASVLGSLLAALAAARLAGNGAALLAGLLHALGGAAIAYGKVGNGDHHAFVSLSSGALIALCSLAFEQRALDSPRRSLALGCCAGALAGLALGSWVAALMYIAQVELALGVLLFLNARRGLPGLAALGLSFHLTALVVLLPAVLSSPWKDAHPWIVVNLSWFHPTYLALGALAFVPLAWPRAAPALARRWPWIVSVAVLTLAVWLALSEAAPARGVREGFEWVSRVDAFMARVGESRPLVGAGTGSALFAALGYGVLLLPAAWGLALRSARRGELRLVPWIVAVALLAAQAARQARFAEALALPMAVVLAVALARLASLPALRRLPVSALGALGCALAIGLSWPSVARCAERFRSAGAGASYERPATLGARLAAEWIGAQPRLDERESVLALWTHGHLIERVAARASVATNFGSYVGVEGFRASPRMLLCEDPDELDALLAERRVRFVLVDSDLPNALNTLLDGVEPQRRARYVAPGSEGGGQVQPAWFRTFGARAMFDGVVFGPEGAGVRVLDRLRLVWVSPLVDPARRLRNASDLAPAAWVWERVRGARVEARGAPGERFELRLELAYPAAGRTLVWQDALELGADGLGRISVPYATDAAQGEGRATGAARWRVGARHGTLGIPERAVREGLGLRVE